MTSATGKVRWRVLLDNLWHKPTHWFAFGIPLGGFLMFLLGILFWGGFHTAIALTNSLEFCISCHEMRDNVFKEYRETIHYRNASGVRAICTDCHVPHEWGPMIVRKISATNELFHKIIGSIDTTEKFEAKRLEMAEEVWQEMKKTDSRECRNCHSFVAMDTTLQSRQAARKHSPEWRAKTGDTCIDCHKGIAHRLPEVTE